jgi:RNA polymerase sigma-70 factor (ECF subfamily)
MPQDTCPRDKPSDAANFKNDLVAFTPQLRAFARSLCGNRDEADDLAQETLARAWQARSSFVAGTNFKAWLFTILRNRFYSDRRKAWRNVGWNRELAELIPAADAAAVWSAELSDVACALQSLTDEQREALILVGAGEFSYADAARVSNCAVGTIKSRVARARRALVVALSGGVSLDVATRPAPGRAFGAILSQLDRLARLDRRSNSNQSRRGQFD